MLKTFCIIFATAIRELVLGYAQKDSRPRFLVVVSIENTANIRLSFLITKFFKIN